MLSCADDTALGPDVGFDVDLSDIEGDGADDADDANDGDGADGAGDADASPEPGDRVEVALDELISWEAGVDDPGEVNVFQIENEADLLTGEPAENRVGDWMLSNAWGRFVIEGDDRVMSPCPYGGNLIDLAGPDSDVDSLGEICVVLQLGQTLDPDTFEVLSDGSDGGPGVLAVTGHMEIDDFFNLLGMIGGLAPGLITELSVDAERIAPYTMTVYYILEPDSSALQVVTALRNDGEERFTSPFIHILEQGGNVELFNPLSSFGGFGFAPLGVESFAADPMGFLAFEDDDTSYGYRVEASEAFTTELPAGASYMVFAGLAFTVLGNPSVLDALAARPEFLHNQPGVVDLEPGETTSRRHWVYVGDGSISSVVDPMYAALEVETVSISGTVTNGAGAALPRARVTAIAGDAAFNQARTDSEGRFSFEVPPGEYDLVARFQGQVTPAATPVDATVAAVSDVAMDVIGETRIDVAIRNPDGDAIPGRVTVVCVDGCDHSPTLLEGDVNYDRLGGNVAAIAFADSTGDVQISVTPGDYRVVVSRGITWSTWPTDAIDSGGSEVSLTAGDVVALTAEIAQVIDTTGALSSDFHLHSIRSMDTPIPIAPRVVSMVAEGVEVLVSTDHDNVTDYAPYLADAGLADQAVSIVGLEVTTDTYGHFNGFPVVRDPESRNGGALDWGGGPGLSVPPSGVFSWFAEQPGEQVIQMNHADGLGLIQGLDVNVLSGEAYADPELMRLPADGLDEETGDNGLWDEGFTAMEILNGKSDDGYWRRMRWWFSMIGRGFAPTGTAVTDTHVLYGHLGAVPRSFVFTGEDGDSVDEFDSDEFAEAINSGRVLGTAGPFVSLSASNGDQTIGLGEVLSVEAGPATVSLRIQMPTWMALDTLDVYTNVEDIGWVPSSTSNQPIEVSDTMPIAWTEEHVVEVVVGSTSHERLEQTVELEMEPAVDSYVVFVLRDAAGVRSPWPASHEPPFAFTNPIYLDADGGGYDNPPNGRDARANERPAPRSHDDSEPRYLTEEALMQLLELIDH